MPNEPGGLTKRTFLQALGAIPASLRLALGETGVEPVSPKFTPIDCAPVFNASDADLKQRMKQPLKRTLELSGRQSLRGVPFHLGPDDSRTNRYLLLGRGEGALSKALVAVPAGSTASFICLAQFCDRDPNETPSPGADVFENVGQRLAEAVIVFDDGTEHRHPIRRRFEVNAVTVRWGHLCFAAVPHRQDTPSKATDSLTNALEWGDLQAGVYESGYGGESVWLAAIPNPYPERKIKALRFEASADDPLAMCGVSLFHGRENPLRYDRLTLYRIALPEAAGEGQWDVAVDLGVVARQYSLRQFDQRQWLASSAFGLGEPPEEGSTAFLYAEVSAAPDAVLTLRRRGGDRKYEFDLARAASGEPVEANVPGARAQVLEREKVWLHGKVVDAGTHQPTPVRISFRSKDGRYIPPYGHRAEVNPGWFQDYGADLKLGDTSYAYVDGTFQIELPVGDVYMEVTKGFEYQPIRTRLEIAASQRELNLEVKRFADLRAKGWVSADSHVHFLAPSTAVLEGQAEGLNLINLLAAQWGDLFTNVADLRYGSLTAPDGDMIVRLGTENRNHILGHLGLLGSNSPPVFPMSAAGPSESYIGDPLWTSLSEWADRCREREGLVMAVHFPYPTGELAAAIVLGKIDAVEIRPDTPTEHFDGLQFLDWYHYLNCGYRLPIFGGTDKMSAAMCAGSLRGYAFLGNDEFTFSNWAKAVRSGNTFTTSGPLLLLEVDGHPPGSEIQVRAGGAGLEIQAEARSTVPIHKLEIVWNGKVVADREERAGTSELRLRDTVRVQGPGWLAARCVSRVPNRERRIAAHTSPVYLVAPGEDLFSAPAAAYMLTLIEGSELWTRDMATRPDAARLARVLDVFTTARARLHQRLHQHGIPH